MCEMETYLICVAALFCIVTVPKVDTTDCTGNADIIFAVPGSLDIPKEEFFPFERFLIMLLDHFVIDANNINVGLILYGREPKVVSYPQPMKDQSQTNARITLLTQRHLYRNKVFDSPNVASALRLMRIMFRNPTGYPLVRPRPGSRRIGVIFTYGKVPQANANEVSSTAKDIKGDGVQMYAIARSPIGPEFSHLGSDSCKLFSMKSFVVGLPSLLPYLGSSICTALDSTITVTERNCFPKFWQPTPNLPVVCPRINAIFQDPYNCAYYYKCDLNIPVREACPPNMLFDDSVKTCNFKESVACYSQVTCPEPVGLFPHPSDCNTFLNCFGNIPYVQKCPDSLSYDRSTKTCRDSKLVSCQVH